MLELTQSAREQLQKYFANKQATPVRVYLSSGG